MPQHCASRFIGATLPLYEIKHKRLGWQLATHLRAALANRASEV